MDTLFETSRYRGVLATGRSDPEMISSVVSVRRVILGSGSLDPETYDHDRLDDICDHVVILDGSRTPVAAIRIGAGQELLRLVGAGGLYCARYWVLKDSLLRLCSTGAELGRAWASQALQNETRGMALLWRALGSYLLSRCYTHLFGTVALEAVESTTYMQLLGYLHRNHLSSRPLAWPRKGAKDETWDDWSAWPTDHDSPRPAQPPTVRRLLRSLCVPPLLRYYLLQGALIVAPPAEARDGAVVRLLVVLPVQGLRMEIERFSRVK